MNRILKEGKYPDGSLRFRETESYDQPEQQAILKEGWYPAAQRSNGQQKYKFNYVNGQKHGVQEYWYPSRIDRLDPTAVVRGGQQRHKMNYVNGQLHGVQESWDENGRQVYKGNFVNGKQHGLQERWYWDGRQQDKENYVNGQLHGLREKWYPFLVDPSDPAVERRSGQQEYRKYYLDGIEVSQQTYQSYIEKLAPEIQATTDFEERLSNIIAEYLLP